MTDPKDKRQDEPSQTPSAGAAAGTEKRSGRVSYDSRGNPVWEWQLETGVYSRDVSTQKLKKLDLGDLSIAETAIQKKPAGLEEPPQPAPQPGGGFNPYDNSSAGAGSNPYDNARARADRLAPQPAAPEKARTPADMHKLNEWIKQKKGTSDENE